jgi:uncharacterized protein (TIGR00369 family)
MTVAEMTAFLDREFPQVNMGAPAGTRFFTVESVGHGTCRVRLDAGAPHLRPGGTVSGPAMFTLADLAFYVAVLAALGPVALAVTTNLNINFLRKPAPGALFAHTRLLKLGQRLAIGEVTITAGNDPEPVAHVTGTYSIPPR